MRQNNRVGTIVGLWIIAVVIGLTAVSASPEPEKELPSRTIYLIRHGDYDHDDERDADIGKALVPLGVVQARLVAARLRGMPVEWSSLHSSTMTRARQTARVISDDLGLEVQTSKILRECTPPTWRADIMADETEEDLLACEQQIQEAFKRYLVPAEKSDQHDIIVGHGNVIRWFVTQALGVESKAWLGMSIGNCSLTVISVRGDGSMKVLAFSDLGHIPPNLQTRTAPGQPRDLQVP